MSNKGQVAMGAKLRDDAAIIGMVDDNKTVYNIMGKGAIGARTGFAGGLYYCVVMM